MPYFPADALHPLRTCSDCKRVMVRRNYDPVDGLPEGAVRFHGKGRCYGCFQETVKADRAARKAEQLRAIDAEKRAQTEANRRALEAYYAGRRARKNRARRRALMEAHA